MTEAKIPFSATHSFLPPAQPPSEHLAINHSLRLPWQFLVCHNYLCVLYMAYLCSRKSRYTTYQSSNSLCPCHLIWAFQSPNRDETTMQQYGVGRSPVQWNLSIVVNNETSIFGQYIQTGGYCKQVILYRISVIRPVVVM